MKPEERASQGLGMKALWEAYLSAVPQAYPFHPLPKSQAVLFDPNFSNPRQVPSTLPPATWPPPPTPKLLASRLDSHPASLGSPPDPSALASKIRSPLIGTTVPHHLSEAPPTPHPPSWPPPDPVSYSSFLKKLSTAALASGYEEMN
ncbi:proline-rich receptor-like protein kinase PERK2 [Prionailurus viverrinus]|uniref:proline-rich receptor-like protein kinase PERK2 n=1 Tax=Prionailurus viverrinus TaxID=61388 RepID=UPI001FF3F607|nr:proline-rich receptor-like protein kinase PERK2 [Prionailurus viverrinus]